MISNEDVTQAIYDMETTAMGAVNMPHPELHTRGEHATVQLPLIVLQGEIGLRGNTLPVSAWRNQFISARDLFAHLPEPSPEPSPEKKLTWQERALALLAKPRKRN